MELGPDLITPHPEFPHPVYLVWVSRVHANRMKMLEIGALHQFGLETELARAVQKKEMQRNTFFFSFIWSSVTVHPILLGSVWLNKTFLQTYVYNWKTLLKMKYDHFSLSGPVLGAKDGKHWNSYFWAISPSPDVTLHLKIPFLRVWSYCNWNILLRRILFNGPNVTAL